MKSFKSILAAISITYAILFSCRLVFIPTPLSPVEQMGFLLTMVEYTFYKSKQLDEYDEESKKKDG